MREWSTDGSLEADTRYSLLVRLLFHIGAPLWLLNLATRYHG